MKAWRCWTLHRQGTGILCSLLAPAVTPVVWEPGTGWQTRAVCAFHPHPAPDDSSLCGRCGWRGEPDLNTLIWWLADWKRVCPPVVGRVELGGRILEGDPAHREIPHIRRAERVAITGPLYVMPGLRDHGQALADRYGSDVRVLAGRPWRRSWLRAIPQEVAA